MIISTGDQADPTLLQRLRNLHPAESHLCVDREGIDDLAAALTTDWKGTGLRPLVFPLSAGTRSGCPQAGDVIVESLHQVTTLEVRCHGHLWQLSPIRRYGFATPIARHPPACWDNFVRWENQTVPSGFALGVLLVFGFSGCRGRGQSIQTVHTRGQHRSSKRAVAFGFTDAGRLYYSPKRARPGLRFVTIHPTR